MKDIKPYEIGLFQGAFKPLTIERNLNRSTPDLRVDIALLESGKSTPCNFSVGYNTPKTSNGGCFARIFAYEYGEGIQANLFSHYGPDITHGDLRNYRHALRACERVEKRLEAIRNSRGVPVDCADEMGRWLEACGVKQVYVRDEASVNEGWLNRGEWVVLTIGAFVSKLRPCLYIGPAKAEETTATEA